MSDKPTLIMLTWESLPEPIKAGAIATVTTLLRVMYDDTEPRWVRRLLESALGGAIGFSVATVLDSFGAQPGWAGAVACIIGIYGVEQAREWGRAIASARISKLKGGKK